MAKYDYILLNIKSNDLQNYEELPEKQKDALNQKDVIYIYRSTKTNKIYIGQTKHFITRHRQHYSGKETKFNDAKFDQVIVLISVYFNGSALDDVESQLITYFIADNPSQRKQQISYDHDEIINLTGGNSVNDYANRENVALEVVLPFWEQVLAPMNWVSTPTLDELRANALVKYSPIKQLIVDLYAPQVINIDQIDNVIRIDNDDLLDFYKKNKPILPLSITQWETLFGSNNS